MGTLTKELSYSKMNFQHLQYRVFSFEITEHLAFFNPMVWHIFIKYN